MNIDHVISGQARPLFSERTEQRLVDRHGLVNPEDVFKAVSRYLPWETTEIHPFNEGKGSCLFKAVGKNNKSAVVKIGLFADHHEPAHEAFFSELTRCRQALPSDKLYVLDYSGNIIPYPYLIREWVPGASLMETAVDNTPGKTDQLVSRIGNALRLVHDIDYPVTGYGFPSQETIHECMVSCSIPRKLIGKTRSVYERFLKPAMRSADILRQASCIHKTDRVRIISMLHSWTPDDVSRGILHGDCSLGNFIFMDDALAGILDGSAAIGYRYEELADVYLYLASFSFHFPSVPLERTFDALCRGYGTHAQHLMTDTSFRCFFVQKLLNHITVLLHMERNSHINQYVSLLRRFLT